MSSFTLKIIAVITMATDHVGAVLFPDIIVLRIIGRIAFPIFAFLLVEGFFYTKSRARYAIRLLIFALISEIPFDFAIGNGIFDFSKQNVIMTFFIAFIMMWGMEKSKNWFYRVLLGIAGMAVAHFLKVDYTFIGILVVFAFYILRNQKLQKFIAQALIFLSLGNIYIYASFAIIPMAFYNGKSGKLKLKYFFYIFYPAHLMLLFFIKNFLQRGKLI